MIVVGVTGSFASGKTETVRIFKKHGAKVFDADRAARDAVRKGRPVYRAIVKMFGKRFLRASGELDRKKLGRHVFGHPGDLRKLNILIHPGVIFECMKVIKRFRRKKGFLAMDVPLLFESKMERLADYTLVIASKRESLIRRAKKKGLPAELAVKILSSQWPLKRKARLADFVIRNDGTTAELEERVVELMGKIRSNDKGRST